MAASLPDKKQEVIEVELAEISREDTVSDDGDIPVREPTMNMTKWLACLALGLSYTTAFQQHACTATIVKHIDAALGPTTYYNWMLSGNNITVSLVLPLAGGLSDIFGRRYFFIVGCCFSLLGTIVALAAKNIPTMIAAMILKGIGSGSQQLSLAAIGEIVPNKHRGTAQAILDLVSLPWTVFGALIGNSMVKHYALSFRVNFIIGIILNLLTITTILLWYHPPPGRLLPGQSKLQRFLALDWAGIGLLACGMVLTLVGIAFGGKTFPWSSPGTILPLTIGICSFIALGIWEWKGAKNPFFAHDLFSGNSKRFGLFLVLTFVGGMSAYSATAFWTQQAQGMFFSDPDQIGLSAIPSGIGGAIGGFIGGIMLGKGKAFRANYILVYGASIKMIADGIFTTITPHRLPIALVAGFLAMFGMGMLLVAVIVCVQLTCADEHIGLATLVLGSVRSMGGSLAVTLYTNVMQSTLKKDSGPRVAAAVAPYNVPRESLPPLIKLLIGSRPKDALKLKGITQQALNAAQEAIKWSWGLAFQHIYYSAIAFTTLALITALFCKDVSHNMTDNIAVTLTNDKRRNVKADQLNA